MIIQTTTDKLKKTLSPTESLMVRRLYELMDGETSKCVVLSDIAKKEFVAVTNTARVARFLEGLGIITIQSMGSKGCFVRVHNQEAFKLIATEE